MTWPWGCGKHGNIICEGSAQSSWCDECAGWCWSPDTMDSYWDLCLCCREPLYQLRIAELERFAEQICTVYEEYPKDHTRPFASYEQVLEWVKRSRRDEIDYLALEILNAYNQKYNQESLPVGMEWVWEDEENAYAIYGDKWDYFYRPSDSTYWEAFKGTPSPLRKVTDQHHAERIICAIEGVENEANRD